MARVPLSRETSQQILNTSTFKQAVGAFLTTEQGQEYTAEEAQERILNITYRTFYRPNGMPKRFDLMSNEPGKPKARYLERVGLREKGSTHRVGETPRKRRRRG